MSKLLQSNKHSEHGLMDRFDTKEANEYFVTRKRDLELDASPS